MLPFIKNHIILLTFIIYPTQNFQIFVISFYYLKSHKSFARNLSKFDKGLRGGRFFLTGVYFYDFEVLFLNYDEFSSDF